MGATRKEISFPTELEYERMKAEASDALVVTTRESPELVLGGTTLILRN